MASKEMLSTGGQQHSSDKLSVPVPDYGMESEAAAAAVAFQEETPISHSAGSHNHIPEDIIDEDRHFTIANLNNLEYYTDSGLTPTRRDNNRTGTHYPHHRNASQKKVYSDSSGSRQITQQDSREPPFRRRRKKNSADFLEDSLLMEKKKTRRLNLLSPVVGDMSSILKKQTPNRLLERTGKRQHSSVSTRRRSASRSSRRQSAAVGQRRAASVLGSLRNGEKNSTPPVHSTNEMPPRSYTSISHTHSSNRHHQSTTDPFIMQELMERSKRRYSKSPNSGAAFYVRKLDNQRNFVDDTLHRGNQLDPALFLDTKARPTEKNSHRRRRSHADITSAAGAASDNRSRNFQERPPSALRQRRLSTQIVRTPVEKRPISSLKYSTPTSNSSVNMRRNSDIPSRHIRRESSPYNRASTRMHRKRRSVPNRKPIRIPCITSPRISSHQNGIRQSTAPMMAGIANSPRIKSPNSVGQSNVYNSKRAAGISDASQSRHVYFEAEKGEKLTVPTLTQEGLGMGPRKKKQRRERTSNEHQSRKKSPNRIALGPSTSSTFSRLSLPRQSTSSKPDKSAFSIHPFQATIPASATNQRISTLKKGDGSLSLKEKMMLLERGHQL